MSWKSVGANMVTKRSFDVLPDKFNTGSLYWGESNGQLPLRTCPGCSVPEPYRSPDWALIPAKT